MIKNVEKQSKISKMIENRQKYKKTEKNFKKHLENCEKY